jgi:glycosyltransferase involved in cell wall biosynthesis
MGKVNELYQILKYADVFLLPSEQESFGLAALEAMAAGTPVISSNTGGIPEVNIHGKTGYLADVGDVKTMSQYAVQLLSDENLLKEMKNNARNVAQTFDLKNIIPQYEELYKNTLRDFKAKVLA